MISVILCTYNRSAMLQEALATLAAQTANGEIDWELLVVDNNSFDDTRQVVEAFAAKQSAFSVRYLFEGRQGKSYALNTGVAHAHGDIIAFTDDDVYVHPDWIREIDKAFRTLPCTGIGGRVRPLWRQPKPNWLVLTGPNRLRMAIMQFEHGDTARPLYGVALVGCNMAFRREAFEKYGGFRADLGPTPDSLLRGEDTEFSQRLAKHGEPLYYVPDAIVDHPVEEKRATKSYYLSWYFDFGRTSARMGNIPRDGRRLFGVPLYLIRALAVNALKWWVTLAPVPRFKCKLDTVEALGRVVEARRLLAEPNDRVEPRPSAS